MKTTYIPHGVCSRQIDIDLEDNIIKSVTFYGGCHGNLQGIARLVEGMSAEEAIRRIRGIRCGHKNTSCPDQLAQALEQAINA